MFYITKLEVNLENDLQTDVYPNSQNRAKMMSYLGGR